MSGSNTQKNNLLKSCCFEDADVANTVSTCKMSLVNAEASTANAILSTSFNLGKLKLPKPLVATFRVHNT